MKAKEWKKDGGLKIRGEKAEEWTERTEGKRNPANTDSSLVLFIHEFVELREFCHLSKQDSWYQHFQIITFTSCLRVSCTAVGVFLAPNFILFFAMSHISRLKTVAGHHHIKLSSYQSKPDWIFLKAAIRFYKCAGWERRYLTNVTKKLPLVFVAFDLNCWEQSR